MLQGVHNQIQIEVAASEAASPDVEAGRAFAHMTLTDSAKAAAALDTGLAATVGAAEQLQDRLHVQVRPFHNLVPNLVLVGFRLLTSELQSQCF